MFIIFLHVYILKIISYILFSSYACLISLLFLFFFLLYQIGNKN